MSVVSRPSFFLAFQSRASSPSMEKPLQHVPHGLQAVFEIIAFIGLSRTLVSTVSVQKTTVNVLSRFKISGNHFHQNRGFNSAAQTGLATLYIGFSRYLHVLVRHSSHPYSNCTSP